MESIHKYPWVFWFNISIRKNWFSYWWKTRNSNSIEFQLCILHISIGRPWLKHVLKAKLKDYKNLDSALETNNSNLKAPFSFQIGKYKIK